MILNYFPSLALSGAVGLAGPTQMGICLKIFRLSRCSYAFTLCLPDARSARAKLVHIALQRELTHVITPPRPSHHITRGIDEVRN
jgi:hypothetical protein